MIICGRDISVEGAVGFVDIGGSDGGLVEERLRFGFVGAVEVGGLAPEAGAGDAVVERDSPACFLVEVRVLPRLGLAGISVVLVVLSHFLLGLDGHVLALGSGDALPGGLLGQRFDGLHGDLSPSGTNAGNFLHLHDLRHGWALIIFSNTFF